MARPFTLEWTQTDVRLRYCVSDFLLFSPRIAAQSCSVPLAPLLPPQFDTEFLSFLRSAPNDAPALCVRNLPIGGPVPKLEQAENGRLRYTLNQYYHYYADLSGTFEDYLAGFSGKSRSTLKRKIKKFAAVSGGKIDYRVYLRPEEMSTYHRLAREVAVKTYQERLFQGGLPGDEAFTKQLLQRAAGNSIRGYLLFFDDQPIAYLHLPVEGTVVQYAYLGYDPQHADVSPGIVLLYCAMQDLFTKRGFRYFDFSYGAGQTKEVFSTGKYFRADLLYFRPSLRNRALITSHAALESTSRVLGRTLEGVHFRTLVKRALRKHGPRSTDDDDAATTTKS